MDFVYGCQPPQNRCCKLQWQVLVTRDHHSVTIHRNRSRCVKISSHHIKQCLRHTTNNSLQTVMITLSLGDELLATVVVQTMLKYCDIILRHNIQHVAHTRLVYPSSAVDKSVAVEKKLDHVGASPLAGHVQWTDGVLQQQQQQQQHRSVSQSHHHHVSVWAE